MARAAQLAAQASPAWPAPTTIVFVEEISGAHRVSRRAPRSAPAGASSPGRRPHMDAHAVRHHVEHGRALRVPALRARAASPAARRPRSRTSIRICSKPFRTYRPKAERAADVHVALQRRLHAREPHAACGRDVDERGRHAGSKCVQEALGRVVPVSCQQDRALAGVELENASEREVSSPPAA